MCAVLPTKLVSLNGRTVLKPAREVKRFLHRFVLVGAFHFPALSRDLRSVAIWRMTNDE